MVQRVIQDRALLAVEVVVGLAVVGAIMGKAYGVAPTVIFLMCGLAATYTGYNVYRMVATLGDPTVEIEGRRSDEARETLEYEKKLILQGIKELEVDYGVGKVDPRDYAALRKTAEERAVRIIARLREDETKWQGEAEALVRDRVPGALPEPAAPAEAPEVTPEAPAAEARPPGLFDDRPAVWRADGDRRICGACGASNDADGRFCIDCGRPRAPEADA